MRQALVHVQKGVKQCFPSGTWGDLRMRFNWHEMVGQHYLILWIARYLCGMWKGHVQVGSGRRLNTTNLCRESEGCLIDGTWYLIVRIVRYGFEIQKADLQWKMLFVEIINL